MASIQIPEPCHENWADFTPTEKGAFCDSCSIDVVDFSNKTPNQVKQILKENAGQHMCGRFRKSQLTDLNNDFTAWENQTTRTFQSKFLYACLIVFGMSLFTSCNLSEQNFMTQFGFGQQDENTARLDVFAQMNEVETDTTKKPVEHKKGKIKYQPEEVLLGKPAIQISEEEPVVSDTIKVEEDCHIKGEISTYEDQVLGNMIVQEDTVKEQEVVPDTVLFNDEMVDGEMWIPESYPEYVEDTTKTTDIIEEPLDTIRHIKGQVAIITEPVVEDPIQVEIEDTTTESTIETTEIIEVPSIFDGPTFESMLFPNPTRDKTTVVINVNELNNFSIYLYSINGKMVKDIYNGMLESGRQEFVIDLSAYQAGSYLIVVNSETQKESLRLEKVE